MDNTLRVRRAEKGGQKRSIPQLEVAKAVGINMNRYWRIEQGYIEPTPAEIKKLARYFRCSPSIIFPALADDSTNTGSAA